MSIAHILMKIQMNIYTKQKQDSQIEKANLRVTKGERKAGGKGEGEIRGRDSQTTTQEKGTASTQPINSMGYQGKKTGH